MPRPEPRSPKLAARPSAPSRLKSTGPTTLRAHSKKWRRSWARCPPPASPSAAWCAMGASPSAI
eukprot:5797530-Pyramimonas_sp.AAC.1